MTDLLTEEMRDVAKNAFIAEIRAFALLPEPTKEERKAYDRALKQALSAVLPLIVEACAKVAKDVITKARMGEIDQDLRSIGHNIDYALREAAAIRTATKEASK